VLTPGLRQQPVNSRTMSTTDRTLFIIGVYS
jgi:hypothetical protein